MNNQRRSRADLHKITFGALLSAMGTALLYFSGIAPVCAEALCAAAGIMPALVRKTYGGIYGWITFFCIGLLGWFIVPNRLYVIAFAVCFGLYPTVRQDFEKIGNAAARLAAKLIFANLSLRALFGFARALVAPYAEFGTVGEIIFALAFNAAFLIYDAGVSQLMRFYQSRVERYIKN